MTVYVFDTSSLIVLVNNYYASRFPSLWQQFDRMIENKQVTSTREVFNETQGHDDRLTKWCKENKHIFVTPSVKELEHVKEIFAVEHFQAMIRKRQQISGKPVADPFVIARARHIGGCVVTEEKNTPNAAKIPNVCKHFKVPCTNLEGFMEREKWKF